MLTWKPNVSLSKHLVALWRMATVNLHLFSYDDLIWVAFDDLKINFSFNLHMFSKFHIFKKKKNCIGMFLYFLLFFSKYVLLLQFFFNLLLPFQLAICHFYDFNFLNIQVSGDICIYFDKYKILWLAVRFLFFLNILQYFRRGRWEYILFY